MRTRAKRLPRLWCALQGLLPLEDCLAAQRGELAWPVEEVASPASTNGVERSGAPRRRADRGNGIAVPTQARDVGADGTI